MGISYLTIFYGFKLIIHIFFRIVKSILPLVNGNSSINEGQIEDATPKGKLCYMCKNVVNMILFIFLSQIDFIF